MTTIPVQPGQSESQRDDNQGTMVVIQFELVSDDQPISEADNDQSDTDDVAYEWLLDMDFMAQTAIPLSIVYPDVSSKGEIHQGTYNDIESDDDQLNPRKRKASLPRGANEVEVGISSVAGSSSTPLPSKKSKLTVDLEELAKNWKMTIEEVK